MPGLAPLRPCMLWLQCPEVTTTEVEVHRELMRLALHNSIRSIPLQIVAVIVMVLMGAAVGEYAGQWRPQPWGSASPSGGS